MAMTFEKKGDGKFTLDCCGYVCPHPQMYAKKSIEKIEEGDVIEIIFDNPSSKETIIQMCEGQGHDLLETKTEGGKITLVFEKG
jgi:tRNA 2-thiouridine synthesizing protein A